MPSRGASREELVALAAAVREHPGTTLEAILAGCINGFTDEDERAAGRHVGGRRAAAQLERARRLVDEPDRPRVAAARASDHAAERGGRVVALTLPHSMRIRLSFLSGFVLDGLPGWREVLSLPVPERMRGALRSRGAAPPRRGRPLRGGRPPARPGELGAARGRRGVRPRERRHEGRTIGEIVDARGDDPFDVLLDIVVADELRTGLAAAVRRRRGRLAAARRGVARPGMR